MNYNLFLSAYNYDEYYAEQMQRAQYYGNVMIICFILGGILITSGFIFSNKNRKKSNPYIGKILLYLGLICLLYGFINILAIPIIAFIVYKIVKLTQRKEEDEVREIVNNINKEIKNNNVNKIKDEFIVNKQNRNDKGEFIVNKQYKNDKN
ncbi:hypothetical protein [Anaerofustis butyriciformans]|uniref:hypothetical protein n=1 Tax=Anaerofustis butyriciformans TaxID=3108533 RepID=UPI002E355759|nr:hypothetical protein [Anaerofustis sp. HA2171]